MLSACLEIAFILAALFGAQAVEDVPAEKQSKLISLGVDPLLCSTRTIHDHLFPGGHGYFFSWEDPGTKDLKLDWLEARKFCRARCMDLVSLETKFENAYISEKIDKERQHNVWTSGRKCNFNGCDRPDLMPLNVFGWFWSGSLAKMPPTTDRAGTDWSETGGLGIPQPDNREGAQGGSEEECMAILNNYYNDGTKWHDVACNQRMPFICEDSDALLSAVFPVPKPDR